MYKILNHYFHSRHSLHLTLNTDFGLAVTNTTRGPFFFFFTTDDNSIFSLRRISLFHVSISSVHCAKAHFPLEVENLRYIPPLLRMDGIAGFAMFP
jgi:hypothetical protein